MVADIRRQQILDAALEVFLRFGYRRTTMEDVARQAGLSRPTLYLSFPGKQAIFCAVVEAGQDRLLGEVQGILQRPLTLRDRLVAVFEAWSVTPFAELSRSPAADELAGDGFAFAGDIFADGLARLVALLADAIADDDALPTPGPSALARARVLVGAARGFKEIARDVEDLRGLIAEQITLTVPPRDPR